MESISNRGLTSSCALWIDFKDMQSDDAHQLMDYAKSVQEHFMDSAYGRQPIPDQLNDLTYGHPSIQALSMLTNGWDGDKAPKPTENIIGRANDVWDLVVGAFGRSLGTPDVVPGASGIVAFTWKQNEPRKQLELWVRDEASFAAEWCLQLPDGSITDGELHRLDDVTAVVHTFLEAR
jgi:hypothetical protein